MKDLAAGCAHCAEGIRGGFGADGVEVPASQVGLRALRHARASAGPLFGVVAPIAPCDAPPGTFRHAVSGRDHSCADCAMCARDPICFLDSLSIELLPATDRVVIPPSARVWRNARSRTGGSTANTPAADYLMERFL